MSVYFYSSDGATDAIRAATGVKGLLFPESEVAEAFHEFWAAHEEGRQFSPNQAYAEAIRGLADNEDFGEELDHFAIIEKSRVARSLFIWNVVCRMAFSARYHSPKALFGRRARAIHREVVRYGQAFMAFYLTASPVVEESYDRRADQMGGGHSGLHGPDIRAARAYLDEFDAPEDLPDHGALAATIDDSFARMWRGRGRLGQTPFYRDAQPVGFLAQALALRIFWPVLTSPQAAGLVVLRFVQLLASMGGPLLRLLGSGRNNQSVNGLPSVSTPAVLSPRGHIDPVGFVANRGQWGSLERRSPDERTAWRGNLLWHVLNRCAAVAGMLLANMPTRLVERQFEAQWEFFGRGFLPDQQVCEAALAVDLAVVDRLCRERRDDPLALTDCARLAAIGLELFHTACATTVAEFEAEGRSADLARAFNLTYMQV